MPQPGRKRADLQECIEHCLDCYQTCQQMAMTHCLKLGGRHVEQDHFRLMMDCAEICRTSAALMLSGSPFHTQTCGVCSQICNACADSCEGLEGMQECVEACRTCAKSCEQMAGGGQQSQAANPQTGARTQ